MDDDPTLYGIAHSNRKTKDFWGKNMFNSSFPVALANYMRDKKIKAQYITVDNNLRSRIEEIDIGDVYNACGAPNNELYFGFEQKYEPYQKYSYEPIPGIDLVVKDVENNPLRPLEVKLTVMPDNTTKKLSPSKWGAEIVIRPPTTTYCALGMMDACENDMDEVREIVEPTCGKIESWQSSVEIGDRIHGLANVIDEFERRFYKKQQPLIMQPIWKTKGQSPILDDHAFDLYVWSDYAFTRLFVDKYTSQFPKEVVSRQMRSTARLARCIYEISKSGKVHINQVYRQMAFNYQTDKEFSVPGKLTNKYMHTERLENPIVPRDALFDIILNGGEKLLMPERRFDQSIYFMMMQQQ